SEVKQDSSMTSRIEHNNHYEEGALNLTYHFEMISDEKRIAPFKKALERVARGKIVFESGTGTGILSLLAVKHGDEAVYCTELDPMISAFTRENIRTAGYDNITVIEKSSLEITPDEQDGRQAAVIVAANLSTWRVTEPDVQVINHLART